MLQIFACTVFASYQVLESGTDDIKEVFTFRRTLFGENNGKEKDDFETDLEGLTDTKVKITYIKGKEAGELRALKISLEP